MTKYKVLSPQVEGYSFNEFVEYGLKHCGIHKNGSMPWSFDFHGSPATHENASCYIVGTDKFTRDDVIFVDMYGKVQIMSAGQFYMRHVEI